MAFVNVTVVPIERDGVLPDRVVIVRDGQILAVEPATSIELPASVKQIDGRGGFLMPGLADMHVHAFTEAELGMFVAAGVTTVRNMFGMPLHLELRADVAAGKIVGPTMITAGPIIDGDPPIWPGSAIARTAADADKIVTEQQAAGYDFLKVYSKLSAEAYRAIVAAAAKHSMPFSGHVPRTVPLSEALRSGQRSIEHLEGYLPAIQADGARPPRDQPWIKQIGFLVAHADESKIDAVARETAQSTVWNCPTIVVMQRMGRMDDPDRLARETRWIEYVHPIMRARWDPKADFRLKNLSAEEFARFRELTAINGKILTAILGAGGKLLVGTDTGNPFVVAGASLHDEIELLVGLGLSRPTVVKAATAGAAEFLGQAKAFGVIAPGARADLVLSATSPLDGPIAIPPVGVMVRGVWHDHAALQALLDAAPR